MRSEAIPVIRLEIDHMKHNIAQMIGIEGSDLEQALNQEIEKQLALLVREQIPSLVRETILECTRKAVKEYFEYGDGAKEIQQSIIKKFGKKK